MFEPDVETFADTLLRQEGLSPINTRACNMNPGASEIKPLARIS